MTHKTLFACAILGLIVCFNGGSATAQTKLRILGWNVESGGNDPAEIADQLEDLGDYDIVALTEVKRRNFNRYRKAVAEAGNSDYRFIASRTGGDDSMLIIYDQNRLSLNSVEELFNVNGRWMNSQQWSFRSPLVAKFYDRSTRKVFLFVVNHLARSDDYLRNSQAHGLRIWADEEKLPLIGMGDLNLDYRIQPDKGNDSYDALFGGNSPVRWVRPSNMIDTNFSDPDGDGQDNFPDTILDFAYVANDAKNWQGKSKIIVRPGDFPDNDESSDHRPVELEVMVQ